MTDRELMQQALYYMDDGCGKYSDDYRKLIEALRARLAQPEPEPVAWYYAGSDVEWHSIALDADLDDAQKANCTPLYTAPPQREFIGLTDEEIKNAWSRLWYDLSNGKFAASDDPSRHTTVMFARAIEAKLKEKNNG